MADVSRKHLGDAAIAVQRAGFDNLSRFDFFKASAANVILLERILQSESLIDKSSNLETKETSEVYVFWREPQLLASFYD